MVSHERWCSLCNDEQLFPRLCIFSFRSYLMVNYSHSISFGPCGTERDVFSQRSACYCKSCQPHATIFSSTETRLTGAQRVSSYKLTHVTHELLIN